MSENKPFEEQAINTLRFLSVDAVQKANSGHPGLPMGAAAMAYTIWTRHLHHNPINPKWFNRDRFILSGGHGSMLLYSLLHLTGYDLSLEELKQFRQWGSRTPGHPERGLTPGVETTTGPLGQGFANGVGMAIVESHLASIFNQRDFKIVDHFTYAIVTDGDLMEGVASEAASIAGHLKLGKLIYIYDDNRVSIDGSTDLSFSEDRGKRFEAYGWQVIHVQDGNSVVEVDEAICSAKKDPRPSLIICRTHIGFGLPTKQDTNKAHGEPPGEEELRAAKRNLHWPEEPPFYIPEDVLQHFRSAVTTGKIWESKWNQELADYKIAFPKEYDELNRRIGGALPKGMEDGLPVFPVDQKGLATRSASSTVINALAERLPELVGGSADLTPSTNTWMKVSDAYSSGNRSGRNFHFGVREHGMGAIVNGMAAHGGVIPFGATFFVFSDYMRPALRISALSSIPSIWVFTHDSIGLGEDGPTHQPIEHLASVRAIPNLVVIRPCDANETREAWVAAIEQRNKPTLLVLSRQALPILDRDFYAPAKGLHKGAYVLRDLGNGKPQAILMASGSEVSLIVQAGEKLEKEGYTIRLVSFPSWDLFEEQSLAYQKEVLPPGVKARLVIEAGVSQGWERWVGSEGKIIALNHFGASAPYKKLYEEFGLTADAVITEVKTMLG